jgi:putative lipoic acid-binding regulatory protein
MDSYKDFKEKLDDVHKWPTTYMFKFVVPSAKAQEFTLLFSKETLDSKPSKKGNYVAFTVKKLVKSSDEVVDIYIAAKNINGLIAL